MALFRPLGLCYRASTSRLSLRRPPNLLQFSSGANGCGNVYQAKIKSCVCHTRCFSKKTNVLKDNNLLKRNVSTSIPRCQTINRIINKPLTPTIQLHGFHTSPRRHVNPVIWVVLKPVGKVGAVLTGRGVRKWWQSLPDKKRTLFIHWVKRTWHLLAVGILLLTAGGLTYYETHLQVAPITGRKRFIAFNHEQFMKIVQNEVEMEIEGKKDKILPATHPYYKYIIEVAERLVYSNSDIEEMRKQKWNVVVVESEAFNAQVYPTGLIVVNTKLMKVLRNKDQLAVILGHEMSHALLEHAAEQVSYAQIVDFFVITFLTAIWAIMPSDGIAIVTHWFMNKVIQIMQTLPYSRKMEKEADRVGLMLAAKACFDVREGSVIWSQMSLAETLEGNKVPEWLSTHPANETRVELIESLLPKMYEKMADCKCPPLPKRDPRQIIQKFQDVEVAFKAKQNLNRLKPVKTRVL